MKNVRDLYLDVTEINETSEAPKANSYSNYAKAIVAAAATIGVYTFWRVSGSSFSWIGWCAEENNLEEQDTSAISVEDAISQIDTSKPEVANTVSNYNQRRAISSAEELSGNQALPLVGATEVGRFTTTTSITDISIRNNLVYVIDGEDTFYVVDFSNPSSPQQLGQYNSTVPYHSFNLVGDYAYVAADAAGIQVLDISNPNNLVLNGTSMVGVNPESISAIYLASNSEILVAYSVEQRKFVSHLSSDMIDIYRVYIDMPGRAYDVALSGNVACVAGYDSGIIVIDISNPYLPQLLVSYDTPGDSYGIALSGDTVYVADGDSGLQIIDVSNPSSPQNLGSYDTLGDAYAVALSGSIAYVADYVSGLQIIDVSDPSSPQLLGSYATLGGANDVALSNSIAYVASQYLGLQIIDVSNPSSPQLLGSYDMLDSALSVVLSNSTAYVANYISGLQIIDVSNPSNPQLLGSYDTPDWAYDVSLLGSIAYVADYVSGLQIIDVSNPSSPQLIGQYDTPSYARGVSLSDNIVYVADGDSGLQVIDVSKSHNQLSEQKLAFTITQKMEALLRHDDYFFCTFLQLGLIAIDIVQLHLNGYDTPGSARGIAVSGSIAYVADGLSGLQVIDVSNQFFPQLLTSYNMPGSANKVVLSNNIAYMTDPSLQIIDVSNPSSPQLLGSYNNVKDIALSLSGSFAYVASGVSGLQIIDISNPSLPQLLGSYDTPGFTVGVALSGNTVYVVDYLSSGLHIIDVSNPSLPQFLGNYDTPGRSYDVTLSDGIVYIADGSSGLQIIDVSNPSDSQFLGSYDTAGSSYELTLSGSIAYVADGISGLQIIDISDPTHPEFIISFDTPGRAYGVAISGSTAYVADYYSGLQILDTSILQNAFVTDMTATVMAATGDYLYLADTGKNIHTLDIGDISNMSELNNYPLTYHARDVAIAGDYLYVAQGTEGIEVLDISTRENPVFIARISLGIDSAQTVRAEGNRLYVNDSNQQIIIFDMASLSYLAFSPREITISEGESHVFTVDEIVAEAVNIPLVASDIVYTPSRIEHGSFALTIDTATTISSFSQQQVDNQEIIFIHDGSEFAPIFSLEVSDGASTYGPFAANINYQPINDAPVLLNNQLTINEGESTILDLSNIDATDIDNLNGELEFIVRQVTNSRFENIAEPNRIVTRFSYNQLAAEQISFVSYLYDEDLSSQPSYQLVAFDGDKESASLNSTITFNAAPRLLRNQIDIYKGQRLDITAEQLLASDVDGDDANLVFVVSNLEYCEFHWLRSSDNTDTVVTEFPQSAITAGEIELHHDNSANPPHYQVQVRDSQMTSKNYTMQVAFENRNLIAANNAPAIGGGAAAGVIGLSLTALGLFAATRYTNNLRSRKKHAFADYVRSELNVAVDNFDTEAGEEYLASVSKLSSALDELGFEVSTMNSGELKTLATDVGIAAGDYVDVKDNCCGRSNVGSADIEYHAGNIARGVLQLHGNQDGPQVVIG